MSSPLASSLAGIYARAPLGVILGLDAMRAACARAGSPEAGLACVHVAGTNGKGSVAAMVEAMARASGLRTGLYTSPHLCRFAERIRIDGEPIDDDALARALAAALAFGPELSFFEVATLAAFLAFRDADVDVAVIEVGLGGRLDATNVIPPPRVAAITRIALDHTDMLGGTLPEIAREKAGIAKPGVEVVVGHPSADVEVIAALEEAITARGGTMTPASDNLLADELVQNAPIALDGAHQRVNARTAALVGARLGLHRDAIREGLARVRWPGRLERVDHDGTAFLLDAAHNTDGAEALAVHLEGLVAASPQARTLTLALVFGALADKPWRAMIARLAPLAATRAFVAPKGRTPADPSALASMYGGTAHAAVVDALAAAAASKPDLVVVAGSIYLVGEARAHLLGLPRDPVVAL